MDFILFGIQGSGKGTQSKLFARRNDYVIFETGSELRKLAQQDSKLGQKIKSIIEAGHLVSNKVVMEIVEHFLQNLPKRKNVIFDGIPRKIEQMESLNALLKAYNREYKAVILNLSKEKALERLTTRRLCPVDKEVYPASYEGNTCPKHHEEFVTRKDDNPESIINRLNAYEEETLPVIEQYRQRGILIEVDGSQSIDDVDKEMNKKLGEFV